MNPNRFTDSTTGPRIAACVTGQFPVVDQAGVYAELDALASALAAEVRVFHSGISDPGSLPPALRARVGTGFFVPPHEAIHRNDLDYFRVVEPERTKAIFDALSDVSGMTGDDLSRTYAVTAAFSYARWMKGWGARYVHSWYVYEQSFHALVASCLLDIPRGITLHGLGDGSRFSAFLAHHVRGASVIVAGTPELRAELVRRFGADVGSRVVLLGDESGGRPAAIAAIAGALRHPAARTGPLDAFLRAPEPRGPRIRPRPMVVLGAERTGSNMITGMLSSRPDVLCVGELFNPRFIGAGLVPWSGGRGDSLPDLHALRAADPGAFLERLFREGEARGDVATGFKLLYFHGVIDDRVIDWMFSESSLRVIHLRRRNRLLRWVSHSIAEETDQWYLDKSVSRDRPPPIELDIVATLADFSFIELMEERYAAVFAGHPGFTMDYEDAVVDIPRTSNLLGDTLGIDLGQLPVRSKKQGRDDVASAVANLQELRRAVSGTRWEQQFAAD